MTDMGLTGAELAGLRDHADGLLAFAGGARTAQGFGWLDERGGLVPERGTQLWITCRMTHVHALAVLDGTVLDGAGSAGELAAHGVDALRGPLHDAEHDGWYAAVDATGPTATAKEAYGHAFVILAAAGATAAGVDGGAALLEHALDVFDRRFWSEADGLACDVWDRGWTSLEPYRGVNANMHTVEALLAAYDVTGEVTWRDRALRIVTRVVRDFAGARDGRLAEHYTEDWQEVADYNVDDPGHPFRPYGVTVGHLFEWSRLALQLRAVLGAEAPAWMEPAAAALYRRGVAEGWQGGETPGFLYTTDFAGRPVVTARMHWVLAEAMAAATTWHRVGGDPLHLQQLRDWWALAQQVFVDPDGGSWWHEVDEHNRPASTVWQGKPDVYHAYQAVLLPRLPLAGSFAGALSAVRAAG
jgi:sulfoquinovose isomerase